ncbi:uncharacterized protein LOC108088228 [Drosophila ficusphila]|uniref:uncharacterized protein LOC108088228 n=1 Tax=Drosophila ficusphila TaxID=30025 RepID=UPI001C8A0377|nr:uncharacterized protein LOC108088228 [Drosophila ficusphila]
MSNFVNLNEKCLLKIVDYLKLEDQLNLWSATKCIPKLQKVVSSSWQIRRQHYLRRNTFKDKEILLQDFLQCIGCTVEKFIFEDFPIDQLYAFRNHGFPNMRVLDYSNEDSDLVNDVKTLVNCFPLIETFKMGALIGGLSYEHHIARWKNLKRLDIMGSSKHWKTICFQEICQKLQLQFLSVSWRESEEDAYVEAISKLQELEELKLDLNLISRENTIKLLNLPKLRKLCFEEFEDVQDFLDNIVEIRGKDVTGITWNENFWLWLNPNRFKNVQKVSIIDEGVVEGIWYAPIFNKSLSDFPQLLELCLANINIWQTGDELWEMIYSCQQLKLLQLENFEMEHEFFDFSFMSMDKALCQRRDPLVINFLNTYHKDLIFQHFIHSKLKIFINVSRESLSKFSGGVLELEFISNSKQEV